MMRVSESAQDLSDSCGDGGGSVDDGTAGTGLGGELLGVVRRRRRGRARPVHQVAAQHRPDQRRSSLDSPTAGSRSGVWPVNGRVVRPQPAERRPDRLCPDLEGAAGNSRPAEQPWRPAGISAPGFGRRRPALTSRRAPGKNMLPRPRPRSPDVVRSSNRCGPRPERGRSSVWSSA